MPYPFNLFTELNFRVIENEGNDDTAITTEHENKSQILAERVNVEGEHFG